MSEPYCLAMVLCDAVHQDTTTGKFTILGTFSTVGAKEFPAAIRLCVYYAVTDGLGPTTLHLRIVDTRSGIGSGPNDEEGVVFSDSRDFDFPDPLLVLEAVVSIPIELPQPGLYHCELWAGDESLMSRRLLALKKQSQSDDEGEKND